MSPTLLGALDLLLALQVTQATLAGTVRNEETREPIAGASVILPDLDRAAETGPEGRYLLHDVPAGPQHIAVRFIGHTPHTLHALVPASGRLEINVSLRSEPVRLRTIQVRSPPSIRGAEGGGGSDRTSSIAAIRNHPLLAEPDALQVFEGGDVVVRPESPGGLHIRGGASDQTAYLLDGIPVFSPYHTAGMFSAWNPDALAQVQLSSSMPAAGGPDALSGSVTGYTRTPGPRISAQGGLSTTQARLTLDGPLGPAGAGFLLSFRSGFPGVPLPQSDPSYVGLESGDWLAKLESPVLGGRLRLLGWNNENELDAAAGGPGPDTTSLRNVFEWESRSYGAGWEKAFSWGRLELTGWSAGSEADSRWGVAPLRTGLRSSRRDLGLLAMVERGADADHAAAGFRLERSRTSYAAGESALDAVTPVASLFGERTRPLGPRTDLTLGATLAAADGGAHLGPRARLRWRPSERMTLAASYARSHQFAQSLRNSESIVGNVFPADLFIGAGARGVPAARSDQGVLAAEFLPAGGVRLGVEAHHRESEGLLLVAPREGGPFAAGALAIGSGRTTGLSLDAALATARLGLVASYGFQHVRLSYQGTDYAPDHGTTHLLASGVIVFPSATLSLRLGASAAFGRRTTAAAGGVEWEACNLLDRGCEFSGSPSHAGEPLGATRLPPYLRVDLGVRKHWHFQVGRREAMVAVYGTVTNLLNRRNVLTYARDPETGETVPVEMRPLAPLLLGVDWGF